MSTLFSKVKSGIIASTVEEAAAAGASSFIGTHHGTFHCDEALATALLKLLPAFADHAVVRTRDPAQLAQCDIVVDVGGEYDDAAKRYDHHQKTFDTVLDGYKTKLSAVGLVYKHYGREILGAALAAEGAAAAAAAPPSAELVDVLYHKMYAGFVEHIDGIDNGVEVADGELRYAVSTTLSSRVSHLNPAWNDTAVSHAEVNERFRGAMLLTGGEFVEALQRQAAVWWPARALVQNAMGPGALTSGCIEAGCPPGEVLVLDTYCPWQAHLFDLEAAAAKGAAEAGLGEMVLAKYVLYADTHGMWRIQAVPASPGSFAQRLPLPAAWRGVRDGALSEVAGIAGCSFVHAAGFIGGNATKEGAMAMAAKAIAIGTEAPAPPEKVARTE